MDKCIVDTYCKSIAAGVSSKRIGSWLIVYLCIVFLYISVTSIFGCKTLDYMYVSHFVFVILGRRLRCIFAGAKGKSYIGSVEIIENAAVFPFAMAVCDDATRIKAEQ